MPESLFPLGALEASVMDAVWALGASTARDVCDHLDDGRAYTTIMTTMDRLYRKGLLQREKDGLAWRYRAAMDRAAYERAVANAQALRILTDHGDAGLAAFVEAAASVDNAMLERLQALIEARKAP